MSAYIITHNSQAITGWITDHPPLLYAAEESASMAPASERQETTPAAVAAAGGTATAPSIQWHRWRSACLLPAFSSRESLEGPQPCHFFHLLIALLGGKCRLTKSHWMWRGRAWYLIPSKNCGASHNFPHILFHLGWKACSKNKNRPDKLHGLFLIHLGSLFSVTAKSNIFELDVSMFLRWKSISSWQAFGMFLYFATRCVICILWNLWSYWHIVNILWLVSEFW